MRGFLVAAETGSLSAAARKLALTQPTLSRQVAALEERLGVTLFERVGKKLALTQTGLELLEQARAMGQAADALALAATGRSQAVEGLVSISASDGISVHILPAIVGQIREAAPGIDIEIISSNAISDLRRREADIAIRHVRPEEPELFAKLLRQARAYFYASQEWVTANGLPVNAEDMRGKDVVGFGRDGQYVEYLRAMGLPVDEMKFQLGSENSLVVWQLVQLGLGAAVMMEEIAAQTPKVVKILANVPPVEFPIWLVTHRELHTNRRIRIVFDILAQALSGEFSAKSGSSGRHQAGSSGRQPHK